MQSYATSSVSCLGILIMSLYIDILTGNLFNCDVTRENLPKNDPSYTQFSCGSQILNASIGFFAAAFGFIFLLISIFAIRRVLNYWYSTFEVSPNNPNRTTTARGDISLHSNFNTKYSMHEANNSSLTGSSTVRSSNGSKYAVMASMWFDVVKIYIHKIIYAPLPKAESVPQTNSLLYVLKSTRSLSVLIAIIAVVIFIPTYIIFKYGFNRYSTHTYNYGWILSAAFLNGLAPSYTVLIYWLFVIVLVHILIIEIDEHRSPEHASKLTTRRTVGATTAGAGAVVAGMETEQEFGPIHWRMFSLKSVSAYIINFFIVTAVNGIYVYVTLTQSAFLGVLALISLVIFKIGWNLVVVPILLMDWFDRRVWCKGIFANLVSQDISKGTTLAHSVLLMFNNVSIINLYI